MQALQMMLMGCERLLMESVVYQQKEINNDRIQVSVYL